MFSIFAPAEAAVARLGFAAKVGLIVVFPDPNRLPLGGLQYPTSRRLTKEMHAEQDGLAHLAGGRQVSEKVPQHRGRSQAVLKGNADAGPKLAAVRAEVEARFAALLKLDDALAGDLGTTPDLHRLHRQWAELRERDERDERHGT